MQNQAHSSRLNDRKHASDCTLELTQSIHPVCCMKRHMRITEIITYRDEELRALHKMDGIEDSKDHRDPTQ